MHERWAELHEARGRAHVARSEGNDAAAGDEDHAAGAIECGCGWTAAARADRRDLALLVGARYWGPGRFGSALAEAVEEGRARRLSPSTFGPPES